MVRDRAISKKFLTPGMCRVICNFCQKWFSLHFDDHIEFLRKMQKQILSRKRCKKQPFQQKILPARYTQSHLQLFAKNRFPAIFGSHLEILCKMQKYLYLGNSMRWNDSDKIFDPQGIHRFLCNCLPKIVFPPFLATILILFFVKCKNMLISEMVQDRVILMKYLTHRVLTESSVTVCQKSFSRHFGSHLKFLRKMQKHVYLRNSVR